MTSLGGPQYSTKGDHNIDGNQRIFDAVIDMQSNSVRCIFLTIKYCC